MNKFLVIILLVFFFACSTSNKTQMGLIITSENSIKNPKILTNETVEGMFCNFRGTSNKYGINEAINSALVKNGFSENALGLASVELTETIREYETGRDVCFYVRRHPVISQ